MWVWVHVHHVCTWMGVRFSLSTFFLSFLFLRHGLSVNLELVSWLDWLIDDLQDPYLSADTHYHALLLMWVLGMWTWVLTSVQQALYWLMMAFKKFKYHIYSASIACTTLSHGWLFQNHPRPVKKSLDVPAPSWQGHDWSVGCVPASSFWLGHSVFWEGFSVTHLPEKI